MKVHYKRAQNSRTLAFAVAFGLCSYRLTCFSLIWVVLGRIIGPASKEKLTALDSMSQN